MNNVWDQMVLSNQLTLRNILNKQENLGSPKLRAAVASLTTEKKDNAICFLKCSTEELAGLLDSQGIQAMVKDGFKFIEELKMKSIGMTEPKQMATFIALGGIATAS